MCKVWVMDSTHLSKPFGMDIRNRLHKTLLSMGAAFPVWSFLGNPETDMRKLPRNKTFVDR